MKPRFLRGGSGSLLVFVASQSMFSSSTVLERFGMKCKAVGLGISG